MPCLVVSRRVILPILFAAAVRAQCPNSIVAGPPSTYAGDGQPAVSAWLYQPNSVTLDAAGNLYIADSGNNRIRKVTTDGLIHTVAGPDGLNDPEFVLAAPDGSVYIADSGNNRIQQITPGGAIRVVAGTGHPGFSGDNGPATAAELNHPIGLTLDAKGGLYFADSYNGRIRRVDTNGAIATVAGGGSQYSLYNPTAIAIAPNGTLYIAGGTTFWRIAPDSVPTTVYEGTSLSNLTLLPDGTLVVANGDLSRFDGYGNALGVYARAENATSLALGPSGIYYTSTGNVIYHASSSTAEPAIFAGQYSSGDGTDNAVSLGPIFGSLSGLAIGADGSIWVADTGARKIRKLLTNGRQKVISSGIAASSLALDAAGNIYAGDGIRIWEIAADGSAHVFAGGGSNLIPSIGNAPMAATAVDLTNVAGMATDSGGNVYVLSTIDSYWGDSLITRIDPAGQLRTIWDSTSMAGDAADYAANGAFAMDAQGYLVVAVADGRKLIRVATDGSGIYQTLPAPDYMAAIATAPSGEIYFANRNGRIKALKFGATLYNRDVESTGLSVFHLFTSAGIVGIPYFTVGVESVTLFALATDSQGNLYMADSNQEVIRRFPVGPCFTVRAPQISVDSPPGPIAPQPDALNTSSILAPGELIAIFGTGLGPQTAVSAQADANGLVPTQLAGTRVLVNGLPAPVLYASDGRVNAAIPFTMYGYSSVLLQVEFNGVLSDAIELEMNDAAPAVITDSTSGKPLAIVLNSDGSTNSPSNPAAPASIVSFYATGFGLTTPQGIDGHLARAPLPKPILPVSVTIDGYSADVLYAGDVSGQVEGLVQVNVLIPPYARSGSVWLTVGDNWLAFNMSIGNAVR